jgi:hypothetical protein
MLADACHHSIRLQHTAFVREPAKRLHLDVGEAVVGGAERRSGAVLGASTKCLAARAKAKQNANAGASLAVQLTPPA